MTKKLRMLLSNSSSYEKLPERVMRVFDLLQWLCRYVPRTKRHAAHATRMKRPHRFFQHGFDCPCSVDRFFSVWWLMWRAEESRIICLIMSCLSPDLAPVVETAEGTRNTVWNSFVTAKLRYQVTVLSKMFSPGLFGVPSPLHGQRQSFIGVHLTHYHTTKLSCWSWAVARTEGIALLVCKWNSVHSYHT